MTPKQHWKLAWRRARTIANLRFELRDNAALQCALNGLSLKPVLSRVDWHQQAWLGLYAEAVRHRRDCNNHRNTALNERANVIAMVADHLDEHWLPFVTIKDKAREMAALRAEVYA